MATAPVGDMRICSGPRFAALLDALHEAADALEAPLTADELEHGWSEELRGDLLRSVSTNREGLVADPMRPELFEDWVDGDDLDPSAQDERRDAVLIPDLVAANLLNAERVLVEVSILLGVLRDTGRTAERRADEELRSALQGCLEAISQRLVRGDYLVDEDFDEWDAILQSHGVRRGSPASVGTRSGGTGASSRFGAIVDFPSGRLWEQVCICDAPLANLAEADLG